MFSVPGMTAVGPPMETDFSKPYNVLNDKAIGRPRLPQTSKIEDPFGTATESATTVSRFGLWMIFVEIATVIALTRSYAC